MLFVPLLGCSHHVGDHVQEDLAKFGYGSERKIEKFKKNPAIYIYIWQLAGTYCSNMMISEFPFPLEICDFGTYIF
jgi:hypothetical protein